MLWYDLLFLQSYSLPVCILLVLMINKALLWNSIECERDVLAVKDILRVLKHISALIRLLTDSLDSMIAASQTLSGAWSAQLINWYQYVGGLMMLWWVAWHDWTSARADALRQNCLSIFVLDPMLRKFDIFVLDLISRHLLFLFGGVLFYEHRCDLAALEFEVNGIIGTLLAL